MQAPADNDDAERLLSEGIAALKAGDNARARELLGQAIRRNPRDDRPWLWLSGAVETDPERRQCLERVLTLNPHNAAARDGLAMLDAAAASAPVAAPPPAVASANPPAPLPTAAALAETSQVAPPPATPPADMRTPDAVDPLAGLRPASAPRRVNPRLVAAVVLACVVVALGAIVVARRLGGPSSTDQSATAAAIALATTATSTATTLPTPTRARPTQTATAAPTATPSATAAPTSTPTASGKLVLQGMAKAQSKDYKGAILLYNQALKLDRQNTEAYFQRGQARDGLDDPRSAIKNYNTVIQIDPQHGAAYSARGDARRKLKDMPGALEDYQHAAEIYASAGDTERSKEIAAKIKAIQ